MKLDLGSGPQPAKGYVTVDCRGTPAILADLEDAEGLIRAVHDYLPGDEPVWEIRACHVLEHVRNLMPLMDACWYMLADGGLFEITVPHKDCETAWNDPTHVRWFLPATFAYFTDHRHLRYVEHYWAMHEPPRNLDAYNRPAADGEPWCNMRCVLRKEQPK
jgi:hypothetical protein